MVVKILIKAHAVKASLLQLFLAAKTVRHRSRCYDLGSSAKNALTLHKIVLTETQGYLERKEWVNQIHKRDRKLERLQDMLVAEQVKLKAAADVEQLQARGPDSWPEQHLQATSDHLKMRTNKAARGPLSRVNFHPWRRAQRLEDYRMMHEHLAEMESLEEERKKIVGANEETSSLKKKHAELKRTAIRLKKQNIEKLKETAYSAFTTGRGLLPLLGIGGVLFGYFHFHFRFPALAKPLGHVLSSIYLFYAVVFLEKCFGDNVIDFLTTKLHVPPSFALFDWFFDYALDIDRNKILLSDDFQTVVRELMFLSHTLAMRLGKTLEEVLPGYETMNFVEDDESAGTDHSVADATTAGGVLPATSTVSGVGAVPPQTTALLDSATAASSSVTSENNSFFGTRASPSNATIIGDAILYYFFGRSRTDVDGVGVAGKNAGTKGDHDKNATLPRAAAALFQLLETIRDFLYYLVFWIPARALLLISTGAQTIGGFCSVYYGILTTCLSKVFAGLLGTFCHAYMYFFLKNPTRLLNVGIPLVLLAVVFLERVFICTKYLVGKHLFFFHPGNMF
ncbi:unnamed protein product [Amoebophrya sp. A120]|nr:unnamed protein product [Amoebophrya sp. A120]|eukprot:GSA120T00014109001.1